MPYLHFISTELDSKSGKITGLDVTFQMHSIAKIFDTVNTFLTCDIFDTHTHTYTHTHAHTHIHTHARAHTHTHSHTHTYIYTFDKF